MELPENIYKTNGGLGVVAKVMGGSGGLDWEDLIHLLLGLCDCLLSNALAQVNLLRCLQKDTSSVRLLSRDSELAKAMMDFSEMHRSHLRDPHWYGTDL